MSSQRLQALQSRLTPIQVVLLNALRDLRREADSTEAEANARAIGGLTETERFVRGALNCRAGTVYLRAGGNTYQIPGVKTGTFHALEDAGLAERVGTYVRAKL